MCGRWTGSVVITSELIPAHSRAPPKTNGIRKSEYGAQQSVFCQALQVSLMAAKVWELWCHGDAWWGILLNLIVEGFLDTGYSVLKGFLILSWQTQTASSFKWYDLSGEALTLAACCFTCYYPSPLSRWRLLGFKSFPSMPILLKCDDTLSQEWQTDFILCATFD